MNLADKHSLESASLRVFLLRLRAARMFAGTTADFPVWRKVRNRILAELLDAPGLRAGSHIRLDRSHPELGGRLKLGRNVEIGAQAIIDLSGGVSVEDNVTLSQGVLILSHDHTVQASQVHWRKQAVIARPVVVEDGAWVGARSVVLGKTGNIGRGAVVGAGSVVTKRVNSFNVVVGNPASQVKQRSEEPVA